ncbi:hypothetical protein TSUD_150870 [Trifolium subterraneum]|uniref:Reverse transcriptase domain-containing protein n=1 Tax=Trifolium subterraneum TaxID=3900 RepID=A0A2Z6M2M4_TRISU|nr:hypothetical protein TSUD_150870 [Trifolium subterraneum]
MGYDNDIMAFLSEFHKSAILPKAITTSFLALIPKKDHPQSLSDYRPICLVSCLYKILSKVLAARLKKVMGKLISDVQTAFLPNRQILDGVLVVNELIDLAKRRQDKCWCQWIRACVFQSSMSVLVNGSSTEDFSVGKGLRQGDPLSPFLFLIVAEGLTGLMRSSVDKSLYHGYKVSNNISFHTLQFADDTIFVGEANWDNLWTIKTVLRSFELVSGLKVNFYKSKLYGINIEEHFLRASSSFLHCEVESIPFRFLGIPVGSNPRRRATLFLVGAYGSFAANFLYGEGMDGLKRASIWWRDIWGLGGTGEGNWLGTNISSVLGDGKDIGFWKEKWMGMEPIRELYPSLFVKSANQHANVSNMGTWDSNLWSWKLVWTAPLTDTETADAAELHLLLDQIQPRRDSRDRRRWIPNTNGFFSVRSAYTVFQNRFLLSEIDPNTLLALKRLWNNNVPSKVLIFGWRELEDTHHIFFIVGFLYKFGIKFLVGCMEMVSHNLVSLTLTVDLEVTPERSSGKVCTPSTVTSFILYKRKEHTISDMVKNPKNIGAIVKCSNGVSMK